MTFLSDPAPDSVDHERKLSLYHLNQTADLALQAKRHAEAITALRAGVVLTPDNARMYSNLAFALQAAGQHEEALQKVHTGIRFDPTVSQLHHNLGMILTSLDDRDGAIAAYRRCIELDPKCAAAHMNLSIHLFAKEQWAEAFREYEWRFEAHESLGKFRKRFAQPHWTGQDLNGKTILVYCEQGCGDVIFFSRWLNQLWSYKPRMVILQVPGNLVRLLDIANLANRVVSFDDELPEHDYVQSICSLPVIYGTRHWRRPNVPPGFQEAFRAEPHKHPDLARVSITWAGSAAHPLDSERSISFHVMSPLTRTAGIKCHLLQKGIVQARHDDAIGDDPQDFADTALLMTDLDLVITVDTAVAHLAGSLGRPVWMLLPKKHDWRWPIIGDRTHWYPTMRIFRQDKAGEWAPVIGRVQEALEEWLHGRSGQSQPR
jgi:tetratricopeptide (TPR) repeat protein